MIRQSCVGDLTVLEWCSISALPLLCLSCRCFTSTLPVLRRCLIIKNIGWASLILFWSANATAVLYQSSGYAALALESCGFGNSQEIRRFSINTVLFHCICFARASPVHFRYSVDIVPILCLCSIAFYPELSTCYTGHMQKIPQCSDGDVRLLIRNSQGDPTSLHHYTSVLPTGI